MASLSLRSAHDDRSHITLLTEPVAIDSADWLLRAHITPDPTNPVRLALCAELVSDAQPPLRVTLFWNEQTFTREANSDGQVCFEDLPAETMLHPNPQISLDVEILNDPAHSR